MPHVGVATLAGTERQPEIRLTFDRDARHAVTGELLTDWVKRAPRRRWHPESRSWVVTAFGANAQGRPRNPDTLLRRAGFQVVLDPPDLHPSLREVLSLEDLVEPVCRQSKFKPTIALIRPRLAGFAFVRDVIGTGAVWNAENEWFEAPLSDLLRHGEVRDHLVVDPATVEAARASLRRKHTFGSTTHDDDTLLAAAATMAMSTGLNLTDTHTEQFARLVDVVGDVPDWFGLDLYPYQRLGAIAALAGRNVVCDPTGLGKTRTALAALAVKDVDRAVLVVPPVVLTNWGRETAASKLAAVKPKPLSKAARKRMEKRGEPIIEPDPHARYIVTFKAGRKEPDLPERGIVIVPDSLLAGRPALRRKIAAWAPQALVYDEAHRARTWTSARAIAMREMMDLLPVDALRLPMTATPLFSNPAELASLLALSGHLDPVFGGYAAFVERYCERNFFQALVANKETLPELRQVLRERVWVRRKKSEVLKDLPKVSSRAQFVDVDLAGFRAAHDEVVEKIMVWLDGWLESEGDYPDDDTIRKFAAQQIGLMSPLRVAAGMSKVPVALDMIANWIDDEVDVDASGNIYCERPLLVWIHHSEVVDALVENLGKLKESHQGMLGVLSGSTSADQRGRFVDEFQAGRLPVLIASISAAGVGITLTHGSDQLFVESSYSVPEVSQAIDRQNRIGQVNPVMVTTLIAEGTLDGRLQQILNNKSDIINEVMDDGADISVVSNDDLKTMASPTQIIELLVHHAIELHRKAPERTKVPA